MEEKEEDLGKVQEEEGEHNKGGRESSTGAQEESQSRVGSGEGEENLRLEFRSSTFLLAFSKESLLAAILEFSHLKMLMR